MRVHQRRIFLFSCMVLSVLLFLMIAFNVKDPLLLNFGEWVQSYLYDFLGPFGDFVFVVITYKSEEHTSELQSRFDLVCRLLLEKKKIIYIFCGEKKNVTVAKDSTHEKHLFSNFNNIIPNLYVLLQSLSL